MTKLTKVIFNMDKLILRIMIVTLYDPDGSGRNLS